MVARSKYQILIGGESYMHSHPNIELYPKPMTRPGRNSLVHVDSKARVGQITWNIEE